MACAALCSDDDVVCLCYVHMMYVLLCVMMMMECAYDMFLYLACAALCSDDDVCFCYVQMYGMCCLYVVTDIVNYLISTVRLTYRRLQLGLARCT